MNGEWAAARSALHARLAGSRLMVASLMQQDGGEERREERKKEGRQMFASLSLSSSVVDMTNSGDDSSSSACIWIDGIHARTHSLTRERSNGFPSSLFSGIQKEREGM